MRKSKSKITLANHMRIKYLEFCVKSVVKTVKKILKSF